MITTAAFGPAIPRAPNASSLIRGRPTGRPASFRPQSSPPFHPRFIRLPCVNRRLFSMARSMSAKEDEMKRSYKAVSLILGLALLVALPGVAQDKNQDRTLSPYFFIENGDPAV